MIGIRLGLLLLIFPLLCVECWVNYEKCDTNDWFKYKENCYYFGDNKYSFYGAEEHCRSNGGSLLSVHSKDEINFLERLIENRRLYGRRWIGLNILQGNGEHKWSDGTPVDYLNLYPKKQYKVEKCFILYTEGSFRPEHCELRYRPICKKPADGVEPNLPPIIPDPVSGHCPEDWSQIGQKCFKFFGKNEQERKTFRAAKEDCLSYGKGYDLASVHSKEEQAFLVEKMGEFGASVWIGLSRVESDEIGHELVYGWTDNSIMNFTSWAPGYPQSNTWQTCIRLSDKGPGKGRWIGDFCDVATYFKFGYVCGRSSDPSLPPPPPPKPSPCGDNSHEYRGDCYSFHSTAASWNAAEQTCQNEGGHLVSVKDAFEEAFLYNFIDGRAQFVWNGLKTVDSTRIFRWSDNELFYYSNWKNFKEVTPDVTHCVAMETADVLKWDTKDCGSKFPFVCKRTSGTRPKPNDVIGECPAGSAWVDIGDNFCYHINRTERQQWGSLSRYCTSIGMEMVSLHNDHQSNSLISYLWKSPYNFWLGLITTFDKKSFMWVDQSPLNYTNWDNREPGSYSTGKDCVSFSSSSSKWKVELCNEWKGVICRAKKTTS